MQAREMSESESIREKARRLTVGVYKYVAMARALRSQAEQIERETQNLLKELERYRNARKQET